MSRAHVIDSYHRPITPTTTRDYLDSPAEATRWHPKLTPYRALTLLFGTVLGTFKVMLVYKELEVASIAVEWVLGTVLYIIFYILGLWERDLQNGDEYSWFFSYDCMNPIWRMLKTFGIGTPIYSTHEDAEKYLVGGNHTLVTNYRLLASTTVIAFGMVKATLTYRGLANGATALDWIFGVVVTAVIYIIGLYEHNPCRRFVVLFNRNDSPIAAFIVREGVLIISALFATYVPIFIVTLFLKEARPFLDDLIASVKDQSSAGWGYYIASASSYTLAIEAGILFAYFSLFTPLMSVYIMLRYFEPTSVASRSFFFVVRRCNLEWLAPTIQCRGLFRALYLTCFSVITTANSAFLHVAGLVAGLSFIFGTLGIAIICYHYNIIISLFCFVVSFVLLLFFVAGAVLLSRSMLGWEVGEGDRWGELA